MLTITAHLAAHGPVARRRDLLIAGFRDRDIHTAMRTGAIFRVRHGWYARRGTPDPVLIAVRVGGVLTGVAALRVRGLFLPRPVRVDVAVPHNAAALRNPRSMRKKLADADRIRPIWVLPQRGRLRSRDWIASDDDALDVVLRSSDRDLAVAACDGLLRYRGWDLRRLERAFARAPKRVRPWLGLVDGRADSWGETYVRLRLAGAGITMEPQVEVQGVGVFDGRVSEHVFVEIDGSQHDADWDGPDPSRFERDHLKDLGLALHGARSIRITYAMLRERWPECVAAIRLAVAADRQTAGRRGAAGEHSLPHRTRPRKLRRFDVGARGA
jgi:hypothetical protein